VAAHSSRGGGERALVSATTYTRTPHLDHLDVEVARLAAAARETAEPFPPTVVAAAVERTVVATLKLDGSPIEALPDHLDIAAIDSIDDPRADGPDGLPSERLRPDEVDVPTNGQRQTGSWLSSFGLLEDAPDEAIIRLEAAGALRAYGADDLVTALADSPLDALRELHRRLTAGLLEPAAAGRPRTTDQAVHDASIGRLLYHTVDPDRIVEELDRLTAWMAGPATDLLPLHAAGLLHLEVLRIHPFEAANGRLARAAARLWLRRGGLDPHGLAVAEAALYEDRLGYHEEVASTLRRRDAGIWLERWGDAVAAGLRQHLREAGWLTHELPDRARAFLSDRAPGEAFTVADYRQHVGGDPATAGGDLSLLLDAGEVVRVPGSRGLRCRVTGTAA
jgi:Fic family protein